MGYHARAVRAILLCFQTLMFPRGTILANSKQSAKRARVSERQRVRNRTYVTSTRTLVRKAESAIKAGDAESTATSLHDAIALLDRAASKGVIHPNQAARRKSRLMAKFNKAESDSAA